MVATKERGQAEARTVLPRILEGTKDKAGVT